MSENNLDIRARLSATDEMSPTLRKILADIRKVESAAKGFNVAFSNIGRTGLESMAGYSRAAQNVAAQMRGIANANKSASRSYNDDWRKATEQRLSESRRMYIQLERMESNYLRQVERRAAAERRQAGRSSRVGGSNSGRIPAPRISTVVIGGAAIGGGIGSAIKKRVEVQAAETRAAMFGELSSAEIKNLRRSTDKLGIRYGVGSTAAIDAAVEGLKAGIEKQYAGQFAELGLKAKAGLDINEADTSKLMGRLTTMHGGFDKPWLNSILNAIAVANNSTAADGNEIVEAYRRSLSVLTETKMKPEDLAAFDASAISIGIQPFKAGTYMSYITSELANAKNARGQRGKDLSQASNLLGFAGRADLSNQMINNPTETLLKVYERMMKMPEALRAKVANLIGQREWRDELLSIAAARDLAAKTIADIANKKGFLDTTALKKIQSMAGRWATIQAVFSLVWEKVGAGFDKIFDQLSDAFINVADRFDFDSISEHVSAFVEGLREGFGFKDWGEAVKTLANMFDTGSIKKWSDFGKGLAEGIKEIAGGFAIAFKALSFMSSGGHGDSAKTMGKLAGEIIGLSVALALLAPAISVLASFVGIIRGLSFVLGGGAVGGPVGAAIGAAAALTMMNNAGLPDTSRKLPGETTSQWRERQRQHKKALYHKSSYTGPTDFSGRRRDPVQDLAENLNQFTGKVERAAFIGGSGSGGLQNAVFVGGGRGSGGGLSSTGIGGRGFISGAPSLTKGVPGQKLPSFNGGSIIRRDKIPNFNGRGGSIAGDLSRSAFERKFSGTPLAGKYDSIVAAARANGISPALLAGIIAHETGNGLVLSGNNPGGIMDPKTGMARKMQFADLDAGISKTAQTVAKNYRRAGGDLDQMGSIYAPPGAANDPRGLNGGWSAGVRKQMNAVAGASSGSAGTGDAVGWAEKFKGMNEYSDARVLAQALGGDVRGRSNAWCARFVNKALENAGGKGTGSAVANSYQRWGSAVSPADVKRNDVILQTHGLGYNQPGGHVGLATGETRTQNGRLQMKMIAGNDGDSVREHWVDIDRNTMVRRGAPPVTSQVPAPSEAISNVPMPSTPQGAGAGDARMVQGNVAIHINGGSHDPEALATLVQRRIDESMNWRTHDTASEYT